MNDVLINANEITSGICGESQNIKIKILYNKNKADIKTYTELLTKFIHTFNEKYDNITSCYNNSPNKDSILIDELDVFNKIENNMLRIRALESQVINLKQKMRDTSSDAINIKQLKSQIDELFQKYGDNNHDNNIINNNVIMHEVHNINNTSCDLDYNIIDKIAELIPENNDVLLKHIVKQINGSAKGLSDFVSLFQKYGKTIEMHKKIVYFQRKGCHFVKKATDKNV